MTTKPNLFKMKLLLGSQSPRRKELLAALGYQFEVVSIDCEEDYPLELPASRVAEYLSELKANAYRPLNDDEVLLTADTVVALEGEILGKPKDLNHAEDMLTKLSGANHQVYTGISLKTLNQTISLTDCADVEFDVLTKEEISYYLEHFNPLDKAGAYGVQDWIGMAKIKKIHGSYYTIMGLPTHKVYGLLQAYVF